MKVHSFKELIRKYQNGELNNSLKKLMDNWYDSLTGKESAAWSDKELDKLKSKIDTQITKENKQLKWLLVKKWNWIGAAAAILILVSIGLYFTSNFGQHTPHDQLLVKADVSPGGNKATLTLENGQTIDLSAKKEGIVIDASTIRYNDGTLLNEEKRVAQTISSNNIGSQERVLVLNTPNGGQYQIELPDGTKVWLNAASTLKYPSRFIGDQRIVELKGEAYFDVVENKKMPFIVKTKQQALTVLGTQFNVYAYEDENATKTTLLEGSVEVALTGENNKKLAETGGKNKLTLMPGEQSIFIKGRNQIDVKAVSLDEAMAWKFVFESENLPSIMKKLARWYDVEVVFEGDFSEMTFTGSISRYDNISEILDKITYTEIVSFEIKERRIRVML